ncbi:hypothetical protein B5X24_HaOG215627 [Helicoverpa armigera]|nr:hypothetical protein B5X24_HaOG215627 [Helicoverpa armigera]
MRTLFYDTIKRRSNTIGERNEFDEAVSLAIFIQDIFGQNILHPKWSLKTKIVYQFFVVFLVTHTILGTMERLEDNPSNICECYFVICIISLYLFKYLLFINSRRNFQKCYLLSKTHLLEIIKLQSMEISKEMMKRIKMMRDILFFCTFVPLTAYFLTEMVYYFLGQRQGLSSSTSTLMPMTSPYYELGMALQLSYFIVASYTTYVLDMWYVVLIFVFCTACDSLVAMLKVKQDEDETELEYKDRLNNTLKTFYENHVKLMEFFNIFKELYLWPTLVPLLSGLVLFCFVMISISGAQTIEWKFVSLVVPATFQIYGYNWYGEQVKNKVEVLLKN